MNKDELIKELNEWYESNYGKDTLLVNTVVIGNYQLSTFIVNVNYPERLLVLPQELVTKINKLEEERKNE